MPLTRYPNGLTACSTTALRYNSAATDGDIDCNNMYVAGTNSIATLTVTNATVTTLTVTNATVTTLTLSTANTFVGERAYITINFDSNAATKIIALPFSGNVIDCWTTCDTTPRTCSAFTLRAGSAGTVYVASVNTLVFATAIGQQIQPALTPAAITTASALNVTVTTAGSAANFSATVVIQRTA